MISNRRSLGFCDSGSESECFGMVAPSICREIAVAKEYRGRTLGT